MKIKAVIFDFGGVFIPSPYPFFEVIAAELGASPAQISEIVFGPQSEDGDHPYHRLERGEIPLEQARNEILQRGRALYNLEVDILQLFARMPAGVHTELVERVRDLRREGYPTAMITNNIREYSDLWRSLLPVEELFDLVVDSSQVGVRKPDPAIFRLALEGLGGVPPECTVFLDDSEGNVRAARSLGMHAIHVRGDISEAIAELDALLGL
ncbi:MAG: HAD family phosphatase [Dehalococcoidia bacterium]|nr:HAD family phosphatase [Dehalococcoidia bacterium]